MIKSDKKELLKDRRVIEEINRHLWIESEKVGHDISFENASQDWLKKFSKAWMDYHMPDSGIFKKGKASIKTTSKTARSKSKAK